MRGTMVGKFGPEVAASASHEGNSTMMGTGVGVSRWASYASASAFPSDRLPSPRRPPPSSVSSSSYPDFNSLVQVAYGGSLVFILPHAHESLPALALAGLFAILAASAAALLAGTLLHEQNVLVAWTLLTAVSFFPEAGLVLFLCLFEWRESGGHLAAWAVRAICNLSGSVAVVSLYVMERDAALVAAISRSHHFYPPPAPLSRRGSMLSVYSPVSIGRSMGRSIGRSMDRSMGKSMGSSMRSMRGSVQGTLRVGGCEMGWESVHLPSGIPGGSRMVRSRSLWDVGGDVWGGEWVVRRAASHDRLHKLRDVAL